MNLQSTLGNQAVLRLVRAGADNGQTSAGTSTADLPNRTLLPFRSSAILQRKLMINAPGDSYEQEADHMAEQVVNTPEPRTAPSIPHTAPLISHTTSGVQRKCSCGGTCADCQGKDDEQHLQMKPAQSGGIGQTSAPPIVHRVLNSPGQPLDAATRAFMEPKFGQDFSHVRVHTGPQATDSAQAVQARAYTVGRNIVFGTGQFAPATPAGRRLLAHELTHVVQQGEMSRAAVQRSPDPIPQCVTCHKPVTPRFSPMSQFEALKPVSLEDPDPLYFGPMPVICNNCHQQSEQANFPTYVPPRGDLVIPETIFAWAAGQAFELAMKDKGRDQVFSALQRHEDAKLHGIWAQPLADVIMTVAWFNRDKKHTFSGSDTARARFALFLNKNHDQLVQVLDRMAVDRLVEEVKAAIRAYSCQSIFIADPNRVKQIEDNPDRTGVKLPVSFTSEVWKPGKEIGPIRVRSAGGTVVVYELRDHQGIYFETSTDKMNRLGCMAGLVANESVRGGILFDEIWKAVSKFTEGLMKAAFSPVEMIVQGAAQVIDLASQSIAAFGKWKGWYHMGYTCLSSVCKDAEACLDSGKSVHECQSVGLKEAAKAASVVIPLYEQGRACLSGDAEACGSIAPLFIDLAPRGPRLRTVADIERADAAAAAKAGKAAAKAEIEQALGSKGGKALTSEEFENAAVREAIGRSRPGDPHIAEAFEKPKAPKKPEAPKRVPVAEKDVAMDKAVHESAQKAGSEVKLDDETHAVGVYGKGKEAEIRFCSEPYCSIVKEKVGAIMNELPKGYDPATMSDLRHLYLEIDGVERDLKAGHLNQEAANRLSHDVARQLDSITQRDRNIRNLFKRTTEDLRRNRAQITAELEGEGLREGLREPPSKPRTKPGTRGSAGTRAARTYHLYPEADVAASKGGFQFYEYRNAEGELLYVGKSGGEAGKVPGNWTDRLKKDHIKAEWIGEAETVTVTSDLSYADSYALEEAMIPLAKYNKKAGEYSGRAPQGSVSAAATAASKHGTVHRFKVDVMF